MLPEIQYSPDPDRIIVMYEPGDLDADNSTLAAKAVDNARQLMPKVTGHSAQALTPIFGDNFFGIYFPDRHTWFLEQGTRGRTMHNLVGKTIPMWIDDPTGRERHANPKAKTRTTVDGRVQVLIFRKAAKKGTRKPKLGKSGQTVPASYPGAPGRIARRHAGPPLTTPGRVAGQIATRNIGVRWYNPGITGRRFLNAAMDDVSRELGLDEPYAYLVDAVSLYTLVRS